MLKTLIRTAAAPARTEASSLLKLVAGEFAARISTVWREPHAQFLTAPAARRHLVCLGLALGRADDAVREALGGRLRVAARRIVTPAPAGLERALGKLGETAWTAPAYLRLVDLLADAATAKLLWHAEAIDEAPVARLALLPAPMRRAWRLSASLTDDGARAVAECHGVIAFRGGAAEAQAAATRWAGLETEAALLEAVREDLYPEPPAPPFPGTGRLKPLATKAALREAARRYDNCLGARVHHAVSGWSVFYEWTGGEGAVIEIERDAIFGWRLNEAKGPRNALLAKDVRAEITDELALIGVYVGRSGWQLERALNADVGRGWRLPGVAEDLADVFGD